MAHGTSIAAELLVLHLPAHSIQVCWAIHVVVNLRRTSADISLMAATVVVQIIHT